MPDPHEAPGALEGVVILDLSEGIAGGYCTKLLAGLGAEVIKVERPGDGDAIRSIPPYKDDVPDKETSTLQLHLAMGKKSVTVDIKSPAGQDVVRRLAEGVDVVVEAFQPGVLAELHLGYEDLAAINPRLVYASITHFGQQGDYAHYKGNELIDYSFGGYTNLTGLPDHPPIKAGGSQAVYQGGLHAATAIMAAIMLREITGEGDYLDVSITEAICYTHANMPLYLNSGEIGHRVGARLTSTRPTAAYPSTILPCKGGFVHVHHAPADITLLGVLIEDPRFSSPEVLDTPRGHADEIDAALTKWLADYDKYEAVRRGQELRHPFTMVLTPGDLPTDPQFVDRDFFVELEHPIAGTFKHLGAPMQLGRTPWRTERAPLLGEHNQEILADRLGLNGAQLAAMNGVSGD